MKPRRTFKLKFNPIVVLTVTALILMFTAITTVSYCWIETGNNLHILTAAGGDAANVSVVNRAGYARNMAKNNSDKIINLNEYVDYNNLYFAPATAGMFDGSGKKVTDVSQAKDVKIYINGADGNKREVTPNDISTNYIDFEFTVKNNDKTHSDIKFANSDSERVLKIDGKEAKFGVAIISTSETGNKSVIFTDSEKLKTETPAIETLYPGEMVTIRVKIWLESDYNNFSQGADTYKIDGEPVFMNLSLVMTDPKKTTLKFSDKTNTFEEEQLLSLATNGYKLYAVNGLNIDENGDYREKFPLTVEEIDEQGVATLSGMPEFLLYGNCNTNHINESIDAKNSDRFELWAYKGGDLSEEPKKWLPGFKPEATETITDTYTIYGDLDVREDDREKTGDFLRGTWESVVLIELRDASVERIFTDESIHLVTMYNGEISYPMLRTKKLNTNTGELEPTNILRVYMPVSLKDKYTDDGKKIHFNSRYTYDSDTMDNLYATLRANNSIEKGKVDGEERYIFTVFGLNGENNGNEDYCFGEWYAGEVDEITLRDTTTGRRLLTYYENNPYNLRVSYKGACNESASGLGRNSYLAHFDEQAGCWRTVLPTTVNPISGNEVQFSVKANDGNRKLFIGSNRVKPSGEYVYSFINDSTQLGSWTYDLADDTVIYVKYNESDTALGHTSLFVEQTRVVPADANNTNWMPLGDWNTANNLGYGRLEGEYKVYYINKYDFNLGSDKVISGEEFKMKPHTNGASAFDSDILRTTDGKLLYVGGRYRIDDDKTVTELAPFGYIKQQKTVVLDVNEEASLPGGVDFQKSGINITYSYKLTIPQGSTGTVANVTKLSISENIADYGQLTFRANAIGEYHVTVTASAVDGTTVKSESKTFIFKVGMNPRITIEDNPEAKILFQYTDENGILRKLINGASAKILKGTVLSAKAPTMDKYSLKTFSKYTVTTTNDDITADLSAGTGGVYTYTVADSPAVIKTVLNPPTDTTYTIAGTTAWQGLTSWDSSIGMSYDSDRNVVFADVTRSSTSTDAKLKIIKGENKNGHRDDGNYCVNYSKPEVKVYVKGVTASIQGSYCDLVVNGLESGKKIRVEYDITNKVISIREPLEPVSVTLKAVPDFENAQITVTAKGTYSSLISAGLNDGTGTAYKSTQDTVSALKLSALTSSEFNSYSVQYFLVESKDAEGTLLSKGIVYPGNSYTMPSDENVSSVVITTYTKQDDTTPFYIASSTDNYDWQVKAEQLKYNDNNTVSGFITVTGNANNECFVRIAKGDNSVEAFQNVNTSVTMSKAGRADVSVEIDNSDYQASLNMQSIKVVLPQGVTRQTLSFTYDLGKHRMIVSTPLYFYSKNDAVDITKDIQTALSLGYLLPSGVTASYTTACTAQPDGTVVTIDDADSSSPKFTADTAGSYTVVTTATATINGEECITTKTFDITVNSLVDVTIKKYAYFDISGVTVTGAYTADGTETTYTPASRDVTFRAKPGDTVRLTLNIPNDKFNGFYAAENNNFKVKDISGDDVALTFTTDYTAAEFTVPQDGATVEANPAQYDSMTYYLTGDSNAVDGISWADGDGYTKTFVYDKITNSITYSDVVLKGNKIANIKISRDGYKSGEAGGGRDDVSKSISYTDGIKFDWSGAPKSVSNVLITDDKYKDIRIEGVFNGTNPKKVNITYYLAEHRLVITDSDSTGTIMTEDLLAVLRKQKVMFYFGIDQDQPAGYLNEGESTGQNHTSFLNSITESDITYNYAPACLPSTTYSISHSDSWTGKSIGENAQAGKAYLLHLVSGNDQITILKSTSSCTVNSGTTTPIKHKSGEPVALDVTLDSATSVSGSYNSLSYYITKVPSTGADYPTIGAETEFMPFDPNKPGQLENGKYIIVPIVSDGSIHVRGAEIKLEITDKTTVPVNVTVEANEHAIVQALSDSITIYENETKQVNTGSEVTVKAVVENQTFNSYTQLIAVEISYGDTKDTILAQNGTATFTVPDCEEGTTVTVKAILAQQTADEIKYFITGEGIDGIDNWAKNDVDAQKMTFDPVTNTVSKEIKISADSVEFKIAKTSLGSNFIDNPLYAISEATPQPALQNDAQGTNFAYVERDYNGIKYNFILSSETTGGSLNGKTVVITYDLTAHKVIVTAASVSETNVTLEEEGGADHAVVTATYGTTTIGEGTTSVEQGTELTLKTSIRNPDFNSYMAQGFSVDGVGITGNKVTVGESPLTITANLTRDITSDNAKFYITGTNIKVNGNALDWSSAATKYADMPYVSGTNTVSQQVTVTAATGAKMKISKGGYDSGETAVGRDNADYSVTIPKSGRDDVAIVNNAEAYVTAELNTSGEAKNRCLYLNYASGVTDSQTLDITYDLDTNTITISKAAEPQKVAITVNPHADYSTSGITVKASYNGGSVEAVNSQGTRDLTSGTVLTLTADIPNSKFNSYKLTGFKVTETDSAGVDTQKSVDSTDGNYYYTIPSDIMAVIIDAQITRSDPNLTLVNRAGTSGAWTQGNSLTYNESENTVTGTYDVTTDGNKYISISNGTAYASFASSGFTDSTGGYAMLSGSNVMAVLPDGSTKQTLRFTYNLKTNALTVDAPVKYTETVAAVKATVNVEKTDIDVKATGSGLTYTYSCITKPLGAAEPTISITTAGVMSFTATAAGEYKVVVTATDSSGYVATKTVIVTAETSMNAPLVSDGNLLEVLRGQKVMFYIGEQNTWGSNKMYINDENNEDSKVAEAQMTKDGANTVDINSVKCTYGHVIAPPNVKYYIAHSGWSSNLKMTENVEAGAYYILNTSSSLGGSTNNIYYVASKSSLNTYTASQSLVDGSTGDLGVALASDSATSVVGKTNSVQYYFTTESGTPTASTKFYRFTSDSQVDTANLTVGQTYYVYPVVYDGNIYVRAASPVALTITEAPTTQKVKITNSTGYAMTATSGGSSVAVGTQVELDRGAEVILTVTVPNAKFNSKSAKFAATGATVTANGTNSAKFTVGESDVTVTASITQADTYPFAICGSGYTDAGWSTPVDMTYDKTANTVTGSVTINSDSAKIKLVKGGDVANNRNSADYSVTVEGNGLTNVTTDVGTFSFDGTGENRNIMLSGANGKTVNITYDLENNKVVIAEEKTTQAIKVYVTGSAAPSSTWGKWDELSSKTDDGSVIYTTIKLGSEFKVSNKADYNGYTDPDISLDNTKGNVTISGPLGDNNLSTSGSGDAYLCCEVATGKIYATTSDPNGGSTSTRTITLRIADPVKSADDGQSGVQYQATFKNGAEQLSQVKLSRSTVTDGVYDYSFEMPSGATTVKFERLSGSGTVWNATGDVTIDSSKNIYKIASWFSGSWI